MKKPLNYFGYAFGDPAEDYNAYFLKSKKGKKELKKIKKHNKRLRKQIKERGFDDSECWNLDCTITKFVLPRLKNLRDITISYPSDHENIEEWHNTLDKMILSFELSIKDDFFKDDEYIKYKEGMELFAKYFMDLWD